MSGAGRQDFTDKAGAALIEGLLSSSNLTRSSSNRLFRL